MLSPFPVFQKSDVDFANEFVDRLFRRTLPLSALQPYKSCIAFGNGKVELHGRTGSIYEMGDWLDGRV